jgi:hypothetical protein
MLALAAALTFALMPQAKGHTWLFTSGRATMQSSRTYPFRRRAEAAGKGTHAQLGPGQSTTVRWASSHNNTFTLAIVALQDQKWCFDPSFYEMVDDYINSAPPGANEAAEKPRYHGATRSSMYLSGGTEGMFDATAGGYGVNDLFKREIPPSHPNYVAHNLDMGGTLDPGWTHRQYEYNPDFIYTEGVQGVHKGRPVSLFHQILLGSR